MTDDDTYEAHYRGESDDGKYEKYVQIYDANTLEKKKTTRKKKHHNNTNITTKNMNNTTKNNHKKNTYTLIHKTNTKDTDMKTMKKMMLKHKKEKKNKMNTYTNEMQ